MRDANTNLSVLNNGGGNYKAAVNCSILILQNVSQTPTNGIITPANAITVRMESSPEGEGTNGKVHYRVNSGTWTNKPLTFGGNDAGPGFDRDWWTADIGKFGACDIVDYYFTMEDQTAFQVTLNNAGANYGANINCLYLVITNPPDDIVVPFGTSAYDVQGIASTGFTGSISWSNQTTGVSGTTAAGSSWQASSVSLATGANVIIVKGGYTTPGGISTNAIDSPTNSAYTTGWTNGSNGGTGFGAWTIVTNGTSAGYFRGTAAGNLNMSVGANGWGMWANSGSLSESRRNFSTPLQIGNIFSARMDNNWIVNNNTVGIGLDTTAGVRRIEFYFRGGEANYRINDSISNRTTTIPYTDTGLDVTIELTATNTYRLIAGGITVTGTLANSGTVGRFRAWNGGSGSGTNYDFFVGTIKITGNSAPVTNIATDSVVITRASEAGVTDTDNDGIPDWWEIMYFGGATNASPEDDDDDDHVSTLDEYYAGTNPTNGASYLMVVMSPLNSAGPVIIWPSYSNRIYELHRSTNQASMNDFIVLQGNIPASVPLNSYTDTTATAEGPQFYRVKSMMNQPLD
jgi:hypothetical protein